MSEFQLPEDSATLTIDFGRFKGAEVEVSLSVGYDVYVVVDEFVRTSARQAEDVDQAMLERAKDMFAEDVLIGWNLRDRKGPIPATREGMGRLPPVLIGQLIATWATAMRQAPPPLETPATA